MKQFLILSALALSLLYLICAFIAWDLFFFHPSSWDASDRAAAIIVSGLCISITGMLCVVAGYFDPK